MNTDPTSPLTKTEWLYAYAALVRTLAKVQPDWQHWPAGHMYFARGLTPEDAARQFLAGTVWGGSKPKESGARGVDAPSSRAPRGKENAPKPRRDGESASGDCKTGGTQASVTGGGETPHSSPHMLSCASRRGAECDCADADPEVMR